MNINYIKQYKMMYPDNQLFYVNINDYHFMFRDITKKEFLNLKELVTTNLDLEDLVCQLAVVYPENIDFALTGMGGLSTTLYPLIIQNSDLEGKAFHEKFLLYRLLVSNSPEEQHKAIIKSVFPEFSYDIMDTWTYDKFILYLTRAEFILKNIHHKDPCLVLVDDENENKNKNKAEAVEHDEISEIENISWSLIKKGVDPILSLWGPALNKPKELPRPFIGSYHWKNEVIMDAIATQIHQSKRI